MELPDVLDVELHEIGCGNVSGCWNEMCHFHEVISDYVDCIERIRFQEFSYKV